MTFRIVMAHPDGRTPARYPRPLRDAAE